MTWDMKLVCQLRTSPWVDRMWIHQVMFRVFPTRQQHSGALAVVVAGQFGLKKCTERQAAFFPPEKQRN